MIEIDVRPRWAQPSYEYQINDNTITVADAKVRKISGTSVGQLLGISPFGTPFTTSQSMLGINDRDLSNNKAIKTGIQLEPRIIKYLGKHHSDLGVFTPAEVIFQERKGNQETWVSDFDDEDFSGHVDGIISKGGNDYILEIKTVKDISRWDGNIPQHYLWQVYLYNHFITKQKVAYFGIGEVTDEDYKNPNHWIPNESNCYIVPIEIDTEMVANELEKLRQFRKTILNTKTTVPYNPENRMDLEVWQHLKDYNISQDDVINLTSRIAELTADISNRKATFRQEEIELETTKQRLKDIMLYRDITGIGNIKMSISKRVSVDVERAEQDGLDLSKYITVTNIPTINVVK